MNTTESTKTVSTLSPRVNHALELFDRGYACSQSIVLAFADIFNLNERHAALISSNFGGGMGRLRRTCGALTGAYMVLGLKFGNSSPDDMETKLNGYRTVRKLTEQFEAIHSTSICKDLITNHATQEQIKERKHHKFICRKVIEDSARLLEALLNENENQNT
ncbi:MAG: C-GCAxxG-C-C family protein [Spirochaetes bacterium]|jgi:C_GCAxxG_C_C family probable redox protein|nr:C-GCAxxG-C-C family protein [Spirochaetota bacterium]